MDIYCFPFYNFCMEIINIANTIYTNYILKFDKDVILVDCGYNTSFNKFLNKINKLNIALEDIKAVVITHVHQDHVSYLEDLFKHIQPKLIVGKNAIELLKKGEDLFLSFSSKSNRNLTMITAKFRGGPASWNPLDITPYHPIVVDKEDDVSLSEYGIKIIPLPGHTEDSIGLLVGEDFIVGDAIMNSIPAKHLLPLLISSAEDFKNSYTKLIETKAKKYYPGHGGIVTYDKLLKNQKYAMELEEH